MLDFDYRRGRFDGLRDTLRHLLRGHQAGSRKEFGLHIDAAGPTGQQWTPARSSYFTVPSRIAFMVTPPIALPIEPNGGMHVYTVRLEDHEERIPLSLHVQVVAGSAFPSH